MALQHEFTYRLRQRKLFIHGVRSAAGNCMTESQRLIGSMEVGRWSRRMRAPTREPRQEPPVANGTIGALGMDHNQSLNRAGQVGGYSVTIGC